jgi:hypothetical protein
MLGGATGFKLMLISSGLNLISGLLEIGKWCVEITLGAVVTVDVVKYCVRVVFVLGRGVVVVVVVVVVVEALMMMGGSVSELSASRA